MINEKETERAEQTGQEIPTITKTTIARTAIELIKSWTGLDIGCIMKKKDGENDKCYVFLGLVEENNIPNDELLEVLAEDVPPKRRLGWFTEFPIRPKHDNYESEIDTYMWYIDLFEKID